MRGINEQEDRYEPFKDDRKVAELLAKARKTNKKGDASDHKRGLASPDISVSVHLRTAICAIGSGLSTINGDKNSVDCIAEGLAMLEDIELLLRKMQPGEN